MKILLDGFVLRQVAIVVVSLSAAGVCHAAPPSPRDEGAARWKQGSDAARAGRLGEAIDDFLAAWALDSSDPTLACDIGRTEFRDARYPEAATWLTRCVHLSPKATTPEAVEYAKNCAIELVTAREKVSRLSIKADPGAHVMVDDEAARVAPLVEDVFVLPGKHHIDAYLLERATSRELTTEPGKEYPVNVELPPLALPPISVPAPAPPQRSFELVGALQLSTGLPARFTFTLIGSEELRPYWLHPDPDDPREPPPGPFRWTPVVVGSILSLGALSTTGVLAVMAATEDDEKRQRAYIVADIVSGAGTMLFSLATLGYMAYETRRTSINIMGQGVSVTHRW